MGEREPRKETISKTELFFLCHPGEENFSGYGLTVEPGRNENLVGLLMVDRPKPADPEWLKQVETAFGEYQLVPMTKTGERGIACQMHIEPESLRHLCQFSGKQMASIKKALEPLLEEPPKPVFSLGWDEEIRAWRSQLAFPYELPREVREVLEKHGYGCIPVEANIGVVHVCYASNDDIAGFASKPVLSEWQLIAMPTAALVRHNLFIMDQPDSPYRFESFLNTSEADQAQVLDQLANQDELYLAFYGDDLNYRFTQTVHQGEYMRYQIERLASQAADYWSQIPPEIRDFDKAKREFMRRIL